MSFTFINLPLSFFLFDCVISYLFLFIYFDKGAFLFFLFFFLTKRVRLHWVAGGVLPLLFSSSLFFYRCLKRKKELYQFLFKFFKYNGRHLSLFYFCLTETFPKINRIIEQTLSGLSASWIPHFYLTLNSLFSSVFISFVYFKGRLPHFSSASLVSFFFYPSCLLIFLHLHDEMFTFFF